MYYGSVILKAPPLFTSSRFWKHLRLSSIQKCNTFFFQKFNFSVSVNMNCGYFSFHSFQIFRVIPYMYSAWEIIISIVCSQCLVGNFLLNLYCVCLQVRVSLMRFYPQGFIVCIIFSDYVQTTYFRYEVKLFREISEHLPFFLIVSKIYFPSSGGHGFLIVMLKSLIT